MRRLFFVFLVFLLYSTPLILKFSVIYLNKPGIKFKTVPNTWVYRQKEELNLDELKISVKDGVPFIYLRKDYEKKIIRITTSVDFSRWFKNKECSKTWNTFYDCMNKKKNPEDEKLYQKIDREFYSELICQNGCEDEDFLKWEVHWYSPAYISITAPIGEKGGFKNLKEAKASLKRINSLLKSVVYGARFPEDYGESSNPNEVFSLEKEPQLNFDYSTAVRKILNTLIRDGFICGLFPVDVKRISKISRAGRIILFLGKNCSLPPGAEKEGDGWYSFYNTAKIEFKGTDCPSIKILK